MSIDVHYFKLRIFYWLILRIFTWYDENYIIVQHIIIYLIKHSPHQPTILQKYIPICYLSTLSN